MNNLLIFDGDCIFCNWVAYYLAKSDKKDVFRFVPNTSELAKRIISENNLQPIVNQSVIVKIENQFYTKADAVYFFCKKANLFPIFRFIIKLTPSFIASYIYDIVASNRKKIIQKQCPTLPNQIRKKFVME